MRIPTRLAACLALLSSACASNEVEPANIRVEVQMVAVPQAKALELLPNLRDAGSIDGAFSEIQKMIASGDARLLAWPEVVGKSGQRMVTESIDEVRYATDLAAQPAPAAKNEAPPQPKAEGAPVDEGSAVPSAFETRNTGATLEVEATATPDGRAIELNLVPQFVGLAGFKAIAGKDARSSNSKIDQPQFYTAKTTTSLTVRSGQRLLLASFNLAQPTEHIGFFILKAEVLPPRAAGSK